MKLGSGCETHPAVIKITLKRAELADETLISEAVKPRKSDSARGVGRSESDWYSSAA